MAREFDTLIGDARGFLTELAANNSRDWFAANKIEYDSKLKAPSLALLDHVATGLRGMTGLPCKTKLFRPQRDVRFSKDKTPYHTHLHMLWTSETGGLAQPGWYLGISPDYVSAGAGVMGFDKPMLARWREAVANGRGADIAGILDALAADGFRISEPELKRVPAPHGADHARGDLLRRKSLTAWVEMDPGTRDLPATVTAAFARLWPLQQALSATFA